MFAIPLRWVLHLVVPLILGCHLEPRADAVGSSPSSTAAPSEALSTPSRQPPSAASRPPFVAPYPRAAWRFVTSDDLDQVVLWFSHILVRHADVRNDVRFFLGYWSSVLPPSTRTRDDALELAQHIADQAAQNPGRFAELARQYSEDLPSREEGGALGGYKASALMPWPQVLDALAALRPGQSSRVVETRYGFHVFYRSAPPPEEVRGGAHLVIGHEDVPWLEIFAAEKVPHRSREEARALANELYRKARAEPARFTALVKQYSEHSDAVAGGDFGDWSTREGTAYPPRMKRLSELAVGEVGAPIETHLGFEIIQRTPVRPRDQYRAHMLVFPFDEVDASVPAHDAAARKSAFAKAEAVAETLARDPSRFDVLDAGRLVWQWEEGRELGPLSVLLKELRPGQITAKPALSEYGFVIAQRLPPEPVRRLAPKLELPAPEQPDLAHFFDSISPADARKFLHRFAMRVRGELALTDATAEQLSALHDLEGRIADDTPYHVLMPLVDGVLEGARQLLGEDVYTRYRAVMNRDVAALLLGAPADSPREQGL
jgi:hypothetical protein